MTSWCVSRTGPATFISFISFTDESARQDHLAEELATALGAKADELFVAAPRAIEHEVLAQIRG